MIEFYILETKKNSYNKKDVCLKKKSEIYNKQNSN